MRWIAGDLFSPFLEMDDSDLSTAITWECRVCQGNVGWSWEEHVVEQHLGKEFTDESVAALEALIRTRGDGDLVVNIFLRYFGSRGRQGTVQHG
jgi:hypothetical protein